ncbi:MAG: PilZ domain-containing protein [Myxococcota bacterium]
MAHLYTTQRSSKRVPHRAPLFIRGEQGVWEGQLVNVSETGILFHSARRWREETTLRITVEEGMLPSPFQARVARCEEHISEDSEHMILVGAAVHFDNAASRARWSRCIERLEWERQARTPIAFHTKLPDTYPTPVFVDAQSIDEFHAIQRRVFSTDGHVFWPSSQFVEHGTPVSLVFVHPMDSSTFTQTAIVRAMAHVKGTEGWWLEIVNPNLDGFTDFIDKHYVFSEVTEAVEGESEY